MWGSINDHKWKIIPKDFRILTIPVEYKIDYKEKQPLSISNCGPFQCFSSFWWFSYLIDFELNFTPRFQIAPLSATHEKKMRSSFQEKNGKMETLHQKCMHGTHPPSPYRYLDKPFRNLGSIVVNSDFFWCACASGVELRVQKLSLHFSPYFSLIWHLLLNLSSTREPPSKLWFFCIESSCIHVSHARIFQP